MNSLKSSLRKNTFIDHTWRIYKTYPDFDAFIFPYLKNTFRRIKNRLASGLPIPDPYLMDLVSGTDDVAWCLHTGNMGARIFKDELERNGISTGEMQAILDFGCGGGRVLRFLHPMVRTRL